MSTADVSIRRLPDHSDPQLLPVAHAMASTLREVLGPERAAEVHDLDEIVGRVRWHLERAPERLADVFVAEASDGQLVGHVLVRRERDDDGPFGLVATIHIAPERRRAGLASRLISTAEHWMRAHGLTRARTWTDRANAPLVALFEGRGYAADHGQPGWTILSRHLPG